VVGGPGAGGGGRNRPWTVADSSDDKKPRPRAGPVGSHRAASGVDGHDRTSGAWCSAADNQNSMIKPATVRPGGR